MKLLFLDEFKEDKKDQRVYGLAAVLIDNSSYARFKKGFYEKLEKLGWDKKVEIKGHYSFSSSKGDLSISIEDRLKFVEKLFELSKTGSTKYASAKVYYTLDFFSESVKEADMYLKLLEKILKKLPKGNSNGNRNGKNNIMIFLDENKTLDIKYISEMSEKILNKKNLYLVERCMNVCSGNETPGIIFVDHVAYFVHNYLKTRNFNEKNSDRVKLLIDKFSEGKINEQELKELDSCGISIKKEIRSANLLKALKKMIYVK